MIAGTGAWFAYGNELSNNISLFSNSRTTHIAAVAGAGNDHVSGSSIRDIISGQSGNDTLLGRAGNDTLNGGEGNDTLRGGNNNDQLNGGLHNDTLYGEGGNDYLVGYDTGSFSFRSSTDVDNLWGGAGQDTFSLGVAGFNPYARGSGFAYLRDFNRAEDRIQLSARLERSEYSLGVGDFDSDGRRDDTAVFYQGNTLGIVINQVGLSLNANYIQYN